MAGGRVSEVKVAPGGGQLAPVIHHFAPESWILWRSVLKRGVPCEE